MQAASLFVTPRQVYGGLVSLYAGQALDVMGALPAGCCAAVVTDPAYWTLDKHREMGTTTRLGGSRNAEDRTGWFETLRPRELLACLREFYRLLPKDGHAWVMSDPFTLRYVLTFARRARFDYVKPFPVFKLNSDGRGIISADGAGTKPGLGYHGRAVHEYAVLCEKGRRPFPDNDFIDVFLEPWTGARETRKLTDDGKGFPTAKPLKFFRKLLALSTSEGEPALDAFAGSGTLGEAGLLDRRQVVLIERDDAALKVIDKRLTKPGYTADAPGLPGMFR